MIGAQPRRNGGKRHLHRRARDRDAVGHPHLDVLERKEAVVEVQRHARQRRHEREADEPLLVRGRRARVEDPPAEPAPRPVGAHEHRANPGRLPNRIEGTGVVSSLAATGVELVAPAPAAAAHELATALEHEVRAVAEQLGIDGGDVSDGARRLRRVVEAREEDGRGLLHQSVDRGAVGERRDAEPRLVLHTGTVGMAAAPSGRRVVKQREAD